MFKIKLLILLSLNIFFFSCASNDNLNLSKNFDLSYIGGGEDGLYLNNLLEFKLNAANFLDKNSNYKIFAKADHQSNFFITNLDNTSDRNNIDSTLEIRIMKNETECLAYSFSESIEQFYLVSPSTKFLSNAAAEEKIKKKNINILVNSFMNDLRRTKLNC